MRHSSKIAVLTYEPSLQGYSLKFTYNKPLLELFKRIIPSHERASSGPPEWIWYFGSKYYDAVHLILTSLKEYKVTILSEEDVHKFQEQQSQNHVMSAKQVSLDEEWHKFYALLPHNGTSLVTIRELSLNDATKWYRKAALIYHPDRNSGSQSAAEKMSQLNEVWSLLKEIHYKTKPSEAS